MTAGTLSACRLDDIAQAVYDEFGEVCLMAGMARCLWCGEAMTIAAHDTHLEYVCRASPSHAASQPDADNALWGVFSEGRDGLRRLTHPLLRRRFVWHGLEVVALDPDFTSPQVIHGLYPRGPTR